MMAAKAADTRKLEAVMPAPLVKTKTPGIYKRGGNRRRFQGVRAGLIRGRRPDPVEALRGLLKVDPESGPASEKGADERRSPARGSG